MSDGIYVALSGAVSQQRALNVIANNVANTTTHGYKGDRMAFRQALSQAGTQGPAPDVLRYNVAQKLQTDHSAGALQSTGNPLDLALQGPGFFAVETPQGVRYTRSGHFVADSEGTVRTKDGHALLGDTGAIQVPLDARGLRIMEDGGLFVLEEGAPGQEPQEQPLGQLRVVRFASPQALEKEGHSLYVAPSGLRPEADGDTQVLQGQLETSNINAVAGLHEMIMATRAFEAFQKVIDTYQSIDEQAARQIASR